MTDADTAARRTRLLDLRADALAARKNAAGAKIFLPPAAQRGVGFRLGIYGCGTVARLGVMPRWLLADADRWRLGSAGRSYRPLRTPPISEHSQSRSWIVRLPGVPRPTPSRGGS